MNPLSDARILAAWRDNAQPWIRAVRERQIESRRLVTDRAIVEAVLEGRPRTALDIGCGEGWLARALAAEGIEVTGIDAIPALIEQAQAAGGGHFRVMSYDEVPVGGLTPGVDAAICNFALLGKTSVEGLLPALPALLAPKGRLLIQTLHPLAAGGEDAYVDGWREGSWAGLSTDLGKPAPWYFRTLESWIRLLADSGLQLIDMREPLHPQTSRPVSVIFTARASR